MARPVAALLAALTVVAACGRPVAGSPAPNPDATQPLTGRHALGDYPTLDYCSLVDEGAFPERVGLVAVNPRPSYDDCLFSVQKNAAEVTIQVGLLEDQDTIAGVNHSLDRRRNPPRGLEVYRGTEDAE